MRLMDIVGALFSARKVIWCVCVWRWGSCGNPGQGRVQICHKGAPGRDRRRTEARNINDSIPAFRLDRGLCGRFGQSAASDRSGRASAGRTAGSVLAWTTPSGPTGLWERRSRQNPGALPGPGSLAHPRIPPGRPRLFTSA